MFYFKTHAHVHVHTHTHTLIIRTRPQSGEQKGIVLVGDNMTQYGLKLAMFGADYAVSVGLTKI